MKKKYKLKKNAIIVASTFIILLIALIIIIAINKSSSYSLEYNIDNFEISENYDLSEKLYYYEISSDGIDYNFIYNHKHFSKKRLITNINKYEEDNYVCLSIESEYISSLPLCSLDEKSIDFYLVPESLKKQIDYPTDQISEEKYQYQNYNIYNSNTKMYIWSYKGFNYIIDNKVEFIKIFNKDIYDIPHATKINNFIVIPNYEQEYNFDEVYILNLENNEVNKWKLDYEISFDSYVLGTNDKSIYIIDNKNKIEYELVPHKEKMRIVANSKKQGVVYNNGLQEKISMNKLISSNYSFIPKNNYVYTLENETLYLSYLDKKIKIQISDYKVSSIIYIKNDNIYYLVDSTLYKYSIKKGEEKLITYSEWEFNNKNLIFIND